MFENLACSFFYEELAHIQPNVRIIPSGIGPDGGKDIILETYPFDGIAVHMKKWIIQCKFSAKAIPPSRFYDDNIPNLQHEHNANGYLLICRGNPTAKLTQSFERMEYNCRHSRKYRIWSGEFFKTMILGHEKLIRQYFPGYYFMNLH